MADYEDIDAMNQANKTWVDAQMGAKGMLNRITPSSPKKVKTFEKRTMVSADPTNPIVAEIIEILSETESGEAPAKAKAVANKTDAEAFLNEFIKEYVFHGGQNEGDWLFVRQIQSGSRGKTAPVKVELSYDDDGDLNVVNVPKSMIYAVDGRKWRKIGIQNLLPQQPVESTPDSSDDSLVSDDNPTPASADQIPAADSASNPASPADEIPPIPSPNDDNPLIALLGGQVVESLRRLNLLEDVKIESLDLKTFTLIDGVDKNSPVKLIGNNGDELEVQGILSGTNFGPIGDDGENYTPFTSANMGEVLNRQLKEAVAEEDSKGGREQRIDQLQKVRKHIDALSRVFGFDDPNQLEAFFAAWLMEESTCRLTGIPGTGKTTVINSAASLLANSYGYNTAKRYLAENSVLAGQTHRYIAFPAGQDYDVNYSDKKSGDTYRAWEGWRFQKWEPSSDTSGAYLYDFRFLQRYGSNGEAKLPLKPSKFASLLLAEPIRNDAGINTRDIRANPIKLADVKQLLRVNKTPDQFTEDSDGNAIYLTSPLYTDSGANEGYYFREFLLEHFYDDRLDDKVNGMSQITDEMLNECGIAKIDYDKRAEEILYGIEIRQITDTQIVGGEEKSVAAYQFDPMPRKIVTQPIKFFNEANRSGSGVEDAILGLIAERTVEYRGQTFKSPKFVAWMDTNPHQKGNDLAFVDRIDMELYFGTLTLGGRYNTLVERYGGAKKATGSRPEYQLLERMTLNRQDSRYIEPFRFADLNNTWGIVNSTPFNASGAEDDTAGALLDISLISVLFTQRFMITGLEDEIWGQKHIFKDAKDVYSSPLVDISTTTNSQFEAQHPNWLEAFGMNDVPFQAPVLITRMLGFRFSNSLIKMTRALAFLRGKDHVTRQEVIDALPYCVGHRLGPAREGEDPKGRDIGIVRDAMRVPNEQDFVREMILNGYVLRNTESGFGANTEGQTPTLFEVWDSFLNTCSAHINSTDAYWKYEESVVKKIQETVRESKGTGITPVHWSIATMVVDNIRRESHYTERYGSYLERLSRPASLKGTKQTPVKEQVAQLLANTSAAQYFRIRGDIAGDPKLFADDREKLLSLVDSKIESLCGRKLNKTSATINSSFVAVAPTEGDEYNMAEIKFKDADPMANRFAWKSYNDGMGVWGQMVTAGSNKTDGIGTIGEGDMTNSLIADSDGNQAISITSIYTIPAKNTTTVNAEFDKKVQSFFSKFSQHTKTGVGIGAVSMGISGLTEEFNDLDAYKSNMQIILNEYLSKNALDQAECDDNMKNGYNACFRLNHIEQGVKDSMTIKQGKQEFVISGEDDLRLWLSLRVIGGNNSTIGGECTIGLYVGITSACMRPTRDTNGMVTDANGNPTAWEVLPFKDTETYNFKNYSTEDWKDYRYQDIGNITTSDYRRFTKMALQALSD